MRKRSRGVTTLDRMQADFLGHVDVKTTQIYARSNLEMKRRALEKVVDTRFLPFRRGNRTRHCLTGCTRCKRTRLGAGVAPDQGIMLSPDHRHQQLAGAAPPFCA